MAKEKKGIDKSLSMMDRLKKSSTIKKSAILAESDFFTKQDMISCLVPAINIALAGDIDGGFTPGITMWAGPSKHFKTLFSLVMMKAYLDKFPEAVAILYDSEYGSPLSYFEMLGIDPNRVLHVPLLDIEELKVDIMNQLDNIERNDKIFFMIDSVGNLASRKEVEDAMDGKSVADMTRAKQLKSLFRMVTPHLNIKNIPMVVVNHTYKTLEMFSKDVVGGGTGSYYSAQNIYILGRQQDKDGNDLQGYTFIINVEKSRYVKEKSKIPVNVSFEDGISRFSALLDLGLESGFVIKPSNGKYQRVDTKTGEVIPKIYSEDETNSNEFWSDILASKDFKEYIRQKYQLASNEMLGDNIEEE